MTRPVVAFQIRGRNPAGLREFYEKLFGWEITTDNALGVPSIAPGIGGPEGVGGTIFPGEPGIVLFVQVADLKASIEKAVELGGKRLMAPFDVPNGPTVAQVTDPEGTAIGLVQL